MNEMKCGQCGGADVVYVEDISCWRRVLGEKNGKTVIDGFYRTDGFDEGTHPRFLCRSCQREWPAESQNCDFI